MGGDKSPVPLPPWILPLHKETNRHLRDKLSGRNKKGVWFLYFSDTYFGRLFSAQIILNLI